MHVKDILDRAKEEFRFYLNSPQMHNTQKKANGLRFIQECKKYMEVFGENSKDRFIFLFSIFLHINSKDDLSIRLYRRTYSNQDNEYPYDIYGYKEFDERLHQDNFIFLDWLESELLSFNLTLKEESHNSVLSENSFHQVLKKAFINLQRIEEFVFDVTKPKKRIEIDYTYHEIYQYKKINTSIKDDILRIILDLEFESIYHKIGNLIACIGYLTMYNEYTLKSSNREVYKYGIHDNIYKIYNWLEKELTDIKIINKKDRGRPFKIKTNSPKIKWEGKNTELRDLFLALKDKHWISIEDDNYKDVCESILGLFVIKGKPESFYEIMKPYQKEQEEVTKVTGVTKIKEKKTRFSGIIGMNKKM